MKGLKLEIAHFALRWHVAKDDEWEAMGSKRRVFLGEVHPSLTRAERLRGPSIMSALPVGKSSADRCLVVRPALVDPVEEEWRHEKIDDRLGSFTKAETN